MRNLLIILSFLVLSQAASADIFRVGAKAGFPLSCFTIYNVEGYEIVKEIFEQDLIDTAALAIEKCELATGRPCKEVNTFTETLDEDDLVTCFAVSIARSIQ